MYSIFCPDYWITDERTGKQYLVLDTDTLKHDDNQQVCHNLGGRLPEPRDELENTFLDNLGTGTFYLGMVDTARGQWVWDSDRSPVAWRNFIFDEPNRNPGENCAVMLRQMSSDRNGHRNDGWGEELCGRTIPARDQSLSLVCERSHGSYTPSDLILYAAKKESVHAFKLNFQNKNT